MTPGPVCSGNTRERPKGAAVERRPLRVCWLRPVSGVSPLVAISSPISSLRQFPVRFGLLRVQATLVRGFPAHSPSSSPDTVSPILKHQLNSGAAPGFAQGARGHGPVAQVRGRPLPHRQPQSPRRARSVSLSLSLSLSRVAKNDSLSLSIRFHARTVFWNRTDHRRGLLRPYPIFHDPNSKFSTLVGDEDAFLIPTAEVPLGAR